MTKLDFHRFQVRHFSNNFEQSPCYCKMGATPESRSKCLKTSKIQHQAKYQRLNANTLYVAAILFSRSSLHRETLPCLPNTCCIYVTYVTYRIAGYFRWSNISLVNFRLDLIFDTHSLFEKKIQAKIYYPSLHLQLNGVDESGVELLENCI